jgi:hypothetical protein
MLIKIQTYIVKMNKKILLALSLRMTRSCQQRF